MTGYATHPIRRVQQRSARLVSIIAPLTRWRMILHSASVLFVVVALSRIAYGQVSTATIRGTVHDPSGAVVSQAELILTNVDTKVQSITTTNSVGAYLFLSIRPGTYALAASANGLTPQEINPLVLQVNQTATLDFNLTLGSVQQVVQVTALGEGVQAATSELGLTLDSEQVSSLPLSGRNFTGLLLLAPGVSPIVAAGSQVLGYTTTIGPAIIPSFNGQTNRSDLILMDGILDIETFGNAYAVQPIVDSIQDMKMQSHNDSAEFGGSTGGTVNIATKSGTNQFHGGAWEFNETGMLQALNYFSRTARPLSQNQFGGDIGGPVFLPKLYNGHNRTFFYFAYEGFRFSSPSTSYFEVPSAAQLSGDFSSSPPLYDPASTTCNSAGSCSRQPFVGNQIPTNRLNSGAIAFAQKLLPPTTATGVAGYNASAVSNNIQDADTFDGRIDQTFSPSDSAFFRITDLSGTSTAGTTYLPLQTLTDAYNYAGSWSHVFSSKSFLQIEGGRTFEQRPLVSRFTGVSSDFGSQVVGFPSGLTKGYRTLSTINPGFAVGSDFSEAGDQHQGGITAGSWTAKGNYTHVIGRHTLKAGIEFNSVGETYDVEYGNLTMSANETSNISSPGTTGDAMASFLLGLPDSLVKRNTIESIGFGGDLGAYFQDQIQASNRLTINAGLRYDHMYVPRLGRLNDKNEYTGDVNFNDGTYIVLKVPESCAITNNAPCIPTPDGSLPQHVVQSANGKVMQNEPRDFQPRVGFAYRMTSTMAIRAGFGVAFDEYAAKIQDTRNIAGLWPSLGYTQVLNVNTATPANPYPDYTIQNLPSITSLPSATPFTNVGYFTDPNYKNAYSLQWNFGVQKQLSSSTVASVSYVGSGNRRLNVGGLYNVATVPGPGTPSLRYPFPYITPTHYERSIGNGSYNALQVQFDRRLAKGLSGTVAYTWSKSIDEGCSGFFGAEGCAVQQIYNIKADRSVSAFDAPQNLSLSWTYVLPIGKGRLLDAHNSLWNYVLGNWQWNGTAAYHSGTPFSVTIPGDPANIGGSNYERPNIVGNTRPQNRSSNQWLNPAAFAEPSAYTFGDMGRNSVRTQFSSLFTMSIFREFPLWESTRLQLRGEGYNIFNHPVFGQPVSTFGATNFGVISSAGGARSVALAAKLVF